MASDSLFAAASLFSALYAANIRVACRDSSRSRALNFGMATNEQ